MTTNEIKRKLSAIFSADVAGYSRLMGRDEAATVRTLTAHKQVMTALIMQHHGRVVDSPGDNLLAEFDSVVNAVQSAMDIQAELQSLNDQLPEDRQMSFRIGINLGDVIVDGERIYGNGVNVAARLESLAEKGGICISGSAYEQIENKLAFGCTYLGRRKVKNIERPVPVYRIQAGSANNGCHIDSSVLGFPKSLKIWGVILMLALLAGAFFMWVEAHRPEKLRANSAPTGTAVTTPSRQASIAVLPFKNLSGDPAQEYFNDGITNDVITDLSRFGELLVIASNTVFTYKGKAVTIGEVGKELGVRYVLEGSIQKTGDSVRINAQLIDAASGNHIWAERYTRDLKDIFELQDDIVQAIVANLALNISTAERNRVSRKKTENLEAYDYILKGYDFFFRRTRETTNKAAEMFSKAIEIDPGYPAGYIGLGRIHEMKVGEGWTEFPEQSLQRAQVLAQRALELDPFDASAHGLLGAVYAFRGQYGLAIGALRQAIVLNPNYASSYHTLGWALLWSGRVDEAASALELSLRLDRSSPRNTWSLLGTSYYLQGRFEEALGVLEQGVVKQPNFIGNYLVLAATYAELGLDDKAAQAATDVRRLDPFFQTASYGTGFTNQEDREKIIAGLRKAGLK
jgi:adenylate cyclase